MKQLLTNNKTSIPRKPPKGEANTARLLNVLLNGGIVNRKLLDAIDTKLKNSSLNSLVSVLRNAKLIPIESDDKPDGTCDYSMLPEEITRYRVPGMRDQQQNEMKEHVAIKRNTRFIKNMHKYLETLTYNAQLWEYIPDLDQKLKLIIKEINALLKKKSVQ